MSALVVALIALPVQAGVGSATGAFTIPLLHAGDHAHYEGLFDYDVTLNGAVTVHAMDGTLISAPAATVTSSYFGVDKMLEAWDLSSGDIVADRFDCSARSSNLSGGQCLTYIDWQFYSAGYTALFGIAALDGRTVSIGDSWTTPPLCATCAPPTSIMIQAPSSQSPSGAAFVVLLTTGQPMNTDPIRLDMEQGSAFPLRITLGSVQSNLTALSSQGPELPNPGPAMAMSFASREHAVSFDGRVPVEGMPMSDWFSLSDAVNATRANPLPQSGSVLTELTYTRSNSQVKSGPFVINQSRTEQITVDSAPANTHDNTEISFSETQQAPDLTNRLPIMPSWAVTMRSVTGPLPQDCKTAIPIWDLARIAAAYAGDSNIHDLSVAAACHGTATVHTPSPGFFENETGVNLQSGLLERQFYWSG